MRARGGRVGGEVWLDGLMAALSIGTLTLILLAALQPHTSELAGSDFKTLYGSTWLFAHGQSAYSEAGIEAVFRANQTVLPSSWFGHAPVYPPFTLALLIPLTALPMVAATQVWMVLSALLLMAAAMALMRYAAEEFALPLWGRALIVILFSVSPLTVGALALGNVSIAVSALSILAFTGRRRSAWGCGALLAAALLLKPHLALWIVLGMLLLGELAGRRIVVRASALAAAFCAATVGWLAMTDTLTLQLRSFLAILAAESAGGASMNASGLQPLRVIVQITSLSSLAGFWIKNQTACAVAGWLLSLLAAVAIYRLTRSLSVERNKLLAVGACCALGMVATYHRSLDAVLLLILLPWVIDRIRCRPRWWQAWLALALYCAMAVGPHEGEIAALVNVAPAHALRSFVLLRQSAIAAALLLMVLLSAQARERGESQRTARM